VSSNWRNKIRSWNKGPAYLGVWVVASLFGAVTLALLVADFHRDDGTLATTTATGKPDPMALVVAELKDPRVTEVASRFNCPCGRCGVMELTECQCNEPAGAVEVKTAIVTLLQEGRSVEEAAREIASRYGSAKVVS